MEEVAAQYDMLDSFPNDFGHNEAEEVASFMLALDAVSHVRQPVDYFAFS